MIVREIVERSSTDPPAPPQPPKAASKAGFPAPKRRPLPPPRAAAASPFQASDASHSLASGSTRTRAPADASDLGSTFNGERIPHVDFQTPHPAPPPPTRPSQRVRPAMASTSSVAAGKAPSETEEIQRQVEQENRARVEAMSPGEREAERTELLERFGGGLLDIMRKRRQKREAAQSLPSVSDDSTTVEGAGATGEGEAEKVFQEVGAENWEKVAKMSPEAREQEIRELEEMFGTKILDALRRRAENRLSAKQPPGPPTAASTSHISVARTASRRPDRVLDDTDPDALKERYFHDTPAEPAKLAWLRPSAPSTDTSVRFDLQAKVLSQEEMQSIPTSEGLHHHGSAPDLAGYTIDDILWLSRSTVPSQRISMLNLLARILGRYAAGELEPPAVQAVEKAEAKRKAVQMGIDIVVAGSRSVGIMAAGIEVLYEGLGGSTWTFLDDPAVDRYRPDEDPNGIAQIPFDELSERFKNLLTKDGISQPASIVHLLRILRRAVFHSRELAEVVVSIVPHVVRQNVLMCPVPLVAADLPSLEALRLLDDVIGASRACAQATVDAALVESLLRFLVVSTWQDDFPLECRYAAATLRIFTSLARYGLSTSIVTSALDVLRPLGSWIVTKSQSSLDEPAKELFRAYWACLAIWTVCAIDPHKTTPEHALTWAQVSALSLEEEAFETLERLMRQGGSYSEIASVLWYLNAWIEGVSINAPNGGFEERKTVAKKLEAWNLGGVVRSALENSPKLPEGIALIQQATRLVNLVGLDGQTTLLDAKLREQLIDKYLVGRSSPETRCLLYQLLEMARREKSLPPQDLLRLSLSILTDMQPGQEPQALNVVDAILTDDLASHVELGQELSSIEHPDKLQILRPLLHHAILPSAEHVVGPTLPSSIYLKATTTLRQPPLPSATISRQPGLPLTTDWLFSPVHDLLHSGTSEALKQAPPDWDPSEVDIVRASLILVRLVQTTLPGTLSRSQVMFGLMCVIMLEKDDQSAGQHTEVFRDDAVGRSLEALIAPFIVRNGADSMSETTLGSLETVATTFLSAETHFYTFYNDFLALFEAISFSDRLFTQLVLPPLAMSYPIDYRKLLWVEQPSVLRSIRLAASDVPLEHGQLSAYFVPSETDQDVLAGYTRALVSGWVTERQDFLWRVAGWHLACLFWGDVSQGMKQGDEVRRGLLRAIVGCPKPDMVKMIVELDVEASKAGQGAKVGREEVQRRRQLVEDLLGAKRENVV